MLISIFTPFHKRNTTFLQQAYESLCEQTHAEWEWIVMRNGEGSNADLSFIKQQHIDSEKVRLYNNLTTGNIGELKSRCAKVCKGEILAELDYDDLITPDCLEELAKAFEDQKIQMAYSNDVIFIVGDDGKWNPQTFSEYYGWITRDFRYKEHELKEMIAWPPSSQSFRRVEWSPDHIRAWRKIAYDKVGGHDINLSIGDDHDLCCRFYIEYGQEGIRHIDKCLYLYRRQPGNSSVVNNRGIQYQTDQNYLKYREQLAIRWAKDNNLRILDLGGSIACPNGYESVDIEKADVVCDLNESWPFKDGEVGVIRASHIFEHLKNPIHTMNEAYRVLAGGGWLLIDVPSTDGRGAWCDATHVSFWNELSFRYYTNSQFAKFYHNKFTGRFQLSRIVTWCPPEFKPYDVPVVQADLICLKPPYSIRPCGEVLWNLNDINKNFS